MRRSPSRCRPIAAGRIHPSLPELRGRGWSEYGGLSKLRFVRAGSLDDPTAIEPSVHIYTRSKLPWVTLPGDVPAFEAYYRASEVWPKESLERREKVIR